MLLFRNTHASFPVDLTQKLCDILRHRGPDDEAHYASKDVQICMTRLAILDLRKGLYPIRNETGNLFLFYNGEIYNFRELASELASKGHSFHSATDAEVVVHAYEEWGPSCLQKFNGMWALAIWDANENTLFLARDHFGIKPLYYLVNEDFFFFASEIRALLSTPLIKGEVNEAAVWDFLMHRRVDHLENTFFSGINRLLPASYATVRVDGSFIKTRYWSMPRVNETARPRMDEAPKNVKELFVDAVRRRLISDVPVGICLSGGIDSSSIVSVIAGLDNNSKKSVGGKLKTFSACFPGESIDESHFVDVATIGTAAQKNKIYISPSEFWHDLKDLIKTQEEPFCSTSIYAQWRVMQEAKARGVTVLLDGQGGDELFAGYVEYFKLNIVDLLKKGRVLTAVREALLSLDVTARYLPLLFRFGSGGDTYVPLYLNPEFLARFRGGSEQEVLTLSQRLYNDFALWILPSLLRYEDKNSMHFSIESRLPFLDPRLVEYVASLPPDFKIRDGWTKSVFREAMRDILPMEISLRRSKIGFETPQESWLVGELADGIEAILSSNMKTYEFLNVPALIELFHTARRQKKISRLDSDLIWRCVCLEIWMREFFSPLTLEDPPSDELP
jgi:asparagine synthase (glutamine-hydrolysing)